MEFVILGLLALRVMTVYENNKALKRGISLFYSASFGSTFDTLGEEFRESIQISYTPQLYGNKP